MGYNIEQDIENSTFFLPKEAFTKALVALKTELKPTGTNQHFIAWYDLEDALYLVEALEATRWDLFLDKDGNGGGLYFIGEKKGGAEAKIFKILAEAGARGRIPMRGEDGDEWAYTMADGKLSVDSL